MDTSETTKENAKKDPHAVLARNSMEKLAFANHTTTEITLESVSHCRIVGKMRC